MQTSNRRKPDGICYQGPNPTYAVFFSRVFQVPGGFLIQSRVNSIKCVCLWVTWKLLRVTPPHMFVRSYASLYSVHSCKLAQVKLLLFLFLFLKADSRFCQCCRTSSPSKSALSDGHWCAGPTQIRQPWWIKPWTLLFHRLGVCADEVSVDERDYVYVELRVCW